MVHIRAAATAMEREAMEWEAQTKERMALAREYLPYLTADFVKEGLTRADWQGGTWVMPVDHSKWKCSVCGLIFKTWKWGNLVRHHNSAGHRRRVVQGIAAATGSDRAAKQLPLDLPGAPSLKAFASVWQRIRQGNSANQGCDGVGCRGKVWRMMCCIAECMFAMDRKFLKGNGTPGEIVVAMHRDEKNGRLQIDFTACNQKLATRSGTMGIVANEGGMLGIINSSSTLMTRFWTDISGTTDSDGLQRFRLAVEVINTDAAADEIAAANEQSRPSCTSTALTPNVKLIARDRAHASQRRRSGVCTI